MGHLGLSLHGCSFRGDGVGVGVRARVMVKRRRHGERGKGGREGGMTEGMTRGDMRWGSSVLVDLIFFFCLGGDGWVTMSAFGTGCLIAWFGLVGLVGC